MEGGLLTHRGGGLLVPAREARKPRPRFPGFPSRAFCTAPWVVDPCNVQYTTEVLTPWTCRFDTQSPEGWIGSVRLHQPPGGNTRHLTLAAPTLESNPTHNPVPERQHLLPAAHRLHPQRQHVLCVQQMQPGPPFSSLLMSYIKVSSRACCCVYPGNAVPIGFAYVRRRKQVTSQQTS